MKRTIRSGVGALAALLLAVPAFAEEYEVKWSASIEAVVKDFESPVDDDGITGFFDQYEFTADKDRDLPFQLALPELSLDVLRRYAELAPAASADGCVCSVIGLPLWSVRRLLAAVGDLDARAPGLDRCAASCSSTWRGACWSSAWAAERCSRATRRART